MVYLLQVAYTHYVYVTTYICSSDIKCNDIIILLHVSLYTQVERIA